MSDCLDMKSGETAVRVYMCTCEREREGGGENPFVACSVATFLPVACFPVNSFTCGICRIVIIFFSMSIVVYKHVLNCKELLYLI